MSFPLAIMLSLCVFFLIAFVLVLLSKAKLLPLLLYLIAVNNLYPVWVAQRPCTYYGTAVQAVPAGRGRCGGRPAGKGKAPVRPRRIL